MGATQPQDDDLAAAVGLGWRVAELYSLIDDPGPSSRDTLLPAHGSLEPADQLELQLRAAAGDAGRAGVTSEPASLAALVGVARRTAKGEHPHEAFRDQLRACHVEINKDLWARSEALGKAYELGNGLSDTYGLVCRAYRDGTADRTQAWRHVFDGGRIERVKKLLDDLQSRLDPTAVAVVREQLDLWRDEVQKRLAVKDVPEIRDVRTGLRRQTVIWRQLIAGDKRPEAYLGAEERARVRDTLRALTWKRYRFWLLPLVLGLAALLYALPHMTDWYRENVAKPGLAPAIVAGIGALGISRASLILTFRTRLHDLADLLWQRALVSEVVRTTLTLDQAFGASRVRHQTRIVVATARAAGRLRGSMAPARGI
jgi:hypothetical protein